MIFFQSDRFQLDLTKFGVSLTEENDIFTDSINKSYSLPFSIKADADILEKLGLPTLENVVNIALQEKGRIVLPNAHYPATLFLGEVYKNNIETKITFGSSDLPIYDVPLKDLPWPIQLAGNVLEFAEDFLDKSWPEVGYNFPMVYKPSISKESGYELFAGFINHYAGGEFLENYVDESGEEDVYVNQNVMAPFPYFLEILKFGFKCAGKNAVGEVFQHPDLKRALYIPQNFLERMDGSEFLEFSFGNRTSVEIENNRVFNIYEKEFIPESDGTYELEFNLNLDPVLAEYFQLGIYRKNALSNELTLLQGYTSFYNRVQLEEKLSIEVTPADELDPILVKLKLFYTDRNIADYNNFEIAFSDGQLNIFPTYFTLSDFVPNMSFGEFVNMLENWWNIEIDVQNNVAVCSFLQNSIFKKPVRDHEHLETNEKKRTSNTNRFYTLMYANDERIFYTKDGQIFSNLDNEGLEKIEIEMNCQPAVVESNKSIITAVAPEEASDLDFCLYDGLQSGKPLCPVSLSRKLSLQNVFENWWQTWLRLRVNGYTFNDEFECSPHEIIKIEELSRKYNELHIIKKINRKIKSEKLMQVDVESETF